MPDHESIRMYSRSRGGRQRSQGAGSTRVPDTSYPSNETRNAGIDGSSRVGIEDAEASQIFNKYHREMGVSTYALRAMFRQTKFSDLKNLDKHITSAQLARLSIFSRDSRKRFEQRLDLSNLGDMDEYLLDFAFAVRPIDTLFEFVDLNQDDVDVRTLRNIFANEDSYEATSLPDDVQLKEIVQLYRDILRGEVDLLSGADSTDKSKQIRVIAERARECFDKVRSMMAENESRTEVAGGDALQAEQEESAVQQPGDFTGPQRITAETMEIYRKERGG